MSEKKYGEHSLLTIPKAAMVVGLDVRSLKKEIDGEKIKTKWVGERKRVIYGSLMKWLYGDKSADDVAREFLKTSPVAKSATPPSKPQSGKGENYNKKRVA